MDLETYPRNARAALLAYIGNTLSPADREDFDRRLLEDEIFSQQVEEVEVALVEEYADGALSAVELATVSPWITNSPQRHAQAKITTALRSAAMQVSTQKFLKRRVAPVWLWVCTAAACVALLVTLSPLRHKQPSTPLVVTLHQPPVQAPKPLGEDTILLEAQRLRGSNTMKAASTPYRLHSNRPTKIQVLVPQGAAVTTGYSIDLREAGPHQKSVPIHFSGLRLNGKTPVQYVEFSLPAGSLAQGLYEAELRSTSGIYRLHFSIAYANIEEP